MIVREEPDAYMLVKQHDHALIAGEFAKHWRERPRPFAPTLYAIDNHDVAWQELDLSVRWNEEAGKPYSFVDYPTGPKLRAYGHGIDRVEGRDPYAACLCSMHYASLVQRVEGAAGARFVEAETRRQAKIKGVMSDEGLRNLEHNLRFLQLCDGLSLFVCLNKPGGTDYPPPYPVGFQLGGTKFEPVWEDRFALRLYPNPFSEPFDLAVPYQLVGKDRRHIESDSLHPRVIC